MECENQCIGLGGELFYSSLPGLPKKVKWPVQLTKDASTVYCRCDNAYFSVNTDNLEAFPNDKIYRRGLALLKTKPKTLKAFIEDVQWASVNSSSQESDHSGDDSSQKRKPEPPKEPVKQPSATLEISPEKQSPEQQTRSRSTRKLAVQAKDQPAPTASNLSDLANNKSKLPDIVNDTTKSPEEVNDKPKSSNVVNDKPKSAEQENSLSEFSNSIEDQEIRQSSQPKGSEPSQEPAVPEQKDVVEEREVEQGTEMSRSQQFQSGMDEAEKKERKVEEKTTRRSRSSQFSAESEADRAGGNSVDVKAVEPEENKENDKEPIEVETKEEEKVQEQIAEKVSQKFEKNSVAADKSHGKGDAEVEVVKDDVKEAGSKTKHTEKNKEVVKQAAKEEKMEFKKQDKQVVEKEPRVQQMPEKAPKKLQDIEGDVIASRQLRESRDSSSRSRSRSVTPPSSRKRKPLQKLSAPSRQRRRSSSSSSSSSDDGKTNKRKKKRYSSSSYSSRSRSRSPVQKKLKKVATDRRARKDKIERRSNSSSGRRSRSPPAKEKNTRNRSDSSSSGTSSSKSRSPDIRGPDELQEQESDLEPEVQTLNSDEDYEPASDHVSESDMSEVFEYYPALAAINMDMPTEGVPEDRPDKLDCVFDKNYSEMYVRKVTYSNDKEQKKTSRVQNSYHACYFCGEMKAHIQDHLFRKHIHEQDVKNIMNCTNTQKKNKLKDLLRAKGDNKHNKKVYEDKKGQLILFRRPTEQFNHEDYGPCGVCLEWMLETSLPKHLKTCRGEKEGCVPSKKYMKTLSDVEKGEISRDASEMLVNEVFTKMIKDEVGKLAQSDKLIIRVGEKWLRSNIDNKVKRAYWASQHMRLAAKLLIQLRNIDHEEDRCAKEKSMWEFLRPAYVDTLSQAALNISLPDMDDVEDLKSPSNSIKIKYDLITMLETKSSLAYQLYDKTQDESYKKNRKEAEGVLTDVKRSWKTKVTKLARKVLFDRKLIKKENLPSPKDLEKLGNHLKEQLSNADMDKETVTWPDYKELVKYAQARLVTYNRRRSGEVEGIRLRNYTCQLKVDDLDESLMGDLSTMERFLMDSHDLIKTRGKHSSMVPVLIPPECRKVLAFLADAEVRRKVNINPKNDFLFAQKLGLIPRRAYESLASACSECDLAKPEQITSTNLRKYMATLAQVMNLTPNQLQQICRHLGHSTKVHLTHYRTMSGYVERVNVGKLLLLQDLNLHSRFSEKSLEEIDFLDMLEPEKQPADTATETASIQENATPPDMQDQEEENDESEGDRHEEIPRKERKRRQPWSEVEREEIELYLGESLKKQKTPSMKECLNAKKKSLENRGQLHKRHYHLIVKKVSAMIAKTKRK